MAQFHRRVPGLPYRGLRARRVIPPAVRALPRVVALIAVLLGSHAQAQGDAAAPRARALPELPEVPKREQKQASKEQLDDLDERLNRFRSKDAHVRKTAVQEILEATPALLPAIDQRMAETSKAADRDAMKALLSSARRKARDAARQEMRAAGKKGKVVTPDYLEIAVEYAKPEDKAWQALVSVLAMSRMLTQIGTVEAVRELIDVYVRFGEFLRVDTQLQLEKLGDKAVAALVETRRHRAEKIARWAERQLDMLGRGIVSEAVRTEDQEVLADVLRAYGRIRDPDSARIIVSFANSERAQIRQAARQAVAMLGEVGAWQLRDSYENTVGKRPPRDWSWDRTARELFGELDRLRLARVQELFEAGLAAERAGNLEEMRATYDKVLARSPNFEQRGEMASGYVAYARKVRIDQPDLALDAVRRARRIAPEGQRASIESLELTLRAEVLLSKNIADQTLLTRALELDPNNEEAKELFERFERGEVKRESHTQRYAAAGAIGLVALVAIAFVALRRGRRREDEAAAVGDTSRVELEAADDKEESEASDESATPNDRDEASDENVAPDDDEGDDKASDENVAPDDDDEGDDKASDENVAPNDDDEGDDKASDENVAPNDDDEGDDKASDEDVAPNDDESDDADSRAQDADADTDSPEREDD
ncbi:MAG: hypothetical protein R3B13_07540 [Polyangiaceae bacterium]